MILECEKYINNGHAFIKNADYTIEVLLFIFFKNPRVNVYTIDQDII